MLLSSIRLTKDTKAQNSFAMAALLGRETSLCCHTTRSARFEIAIPIRATEPNTIIINHADRATVGELASFLVAKRKPETELKIG